MDDAHVLWVTRATSFSVQITSSWAKLESSHHGFSSSAVHVVVGSMVGSWLIFFFSYLFSLFSPCQRIHVYFHFFLYNLILIFFIWIVFIFFINFSFLFHPSSFGLILFKFKIWSLFFYFFYFYHFRDWILFLIPPINILYHIIFVLNLVYIILIVIYFVLEGFFMIYCF